MAPTVLVVEDDGTIASAMAAHLRTAGFAPVEARDGREALARLASEAVDCCVLDLLLPELDGWEVLETMRGRGDVTPVLAVSALGADAARARALAVGADDFLAKPFSMGELVAQVRDVMSSADLDQVSPELAPLVFSLLYGWP
jgi:two-component system OmpR family response regulator